MAIAQLTTNVTAQKTALLRPPSSVVHEPARAESRPGLEPARLVDPWTRGLEPSPDLDSRTRARLEPPRNRQETAKRLESRVESARGPLSEPARAAKRLESARGPLFEPPRDRLPRDSSRLVAPPGSKGSSPLGSCTTLPPSRDPIRERQMKISTAAKWLTQAEKR